MKIVESLAIGEPKTKKAVELIGSLGAADRKCLLVLSQKSDDLIRATNNIPGVKTTTARDVNVYDVLNSDAILIEKDAVGAIVEVLGR